MIPTYLITSGEYVEWSQILEPKPSGSVSLSSAQPGFRRPGRPVVPVDRHARRDQRDSADKIEPALAAEPIEKMEATAATDPIDRTDPAEPMHRIEPAEPMDKIDPLDPMLRSEPAEPADRREVSVFAMLGFSHPLPISGMSERSRGSKLRPVAGCRAQRQATLKRALGLYRPGQPGPGSRPGGGRYPALAGRDPASTEPIPRHAPWPVRAE